MKSYLSLVPISAKVRKRQNRMTIFCIVISVFLVTAIFSVSDMMIRTQSDRMTDKNGSWHIKLEGISQETALAISRREDVTSIGAVTIFNPDGELPYRLNGKRVVLYGIDETYLSMNASDTIEGRFPEETGEIMLSPNAARILQIAVGDTVVLDTPSGSSEFTISGLGGVEKSYYSGQYSLMDAYLPRDAFATLTEHSGIEGLQTSYCIQFTSAAKAAKAIPELMKVYQLPENAVAENTGVMAIAGQSNSNAAKNVYGLAAVLFVLVLLAGVLMISGSMNSNLAQRTQFFGMMRCIGMSKAQVIRFVRLEALNWCKTAVPIGVLLGTFASWGICGALHYGIGGEFSTTPVFEISPVGSISGIVVGIVTVLLAAESPARRASQVSPVTAVSGAETRFSVSHPAAIDRRWKIERSLGVHHAISGKKNLFLLTASFALSIILALSFSVLLKFAGLLLPGQAPWQPDILLNGYGNEQVFSRDMVRQLRTIPGVGNIWSATGLTGFPASDPRNKISQVVLGSYDDFLMDKSRPLVVAGRMADPSADSSEAMTIYNKDNPLKVGDTVCIGGKSLTVAGAFSEGMFPEEITVICPQALFDRLVGVQNYNMVGILLDTSATEDTVMQIARLSTDEIVMSDIREQNIQEAATYLASRIVVYSFLAIIGLISLFNMINSISISVSARSKQYGIMRAIGMAGSQLTRMIAAEALSYGLLGILAGFVLGMPLYRLLFTTLITHYFGISCTIPWLCLAVIVGFVLCSVAAAVYIPAKRIREMSITAAISEL